MIIKQCNLAKHAKNLEAFPRRKKNCKIGEKIFNISNQVHQMNKVVENWYLVPHKNWHNTKN